MLSVCGLLLLSTLTTESSVWIVAIGMLLQTSGTGTFYPPNNSSIMQQVPESRYGVMSGFINLVRNSANITGTAVATAIVAAVMVSMGYLPNLSSIAETGDTGLLTAFVTGLRTVYIVIAGLVVVGVVFSFIRPASQPSGSRRRGEADSGAIMAAGRGTVGKTPIVRIKERDSNQVKTAVVASNDKGTLQGFVTDNTSAHATVYTN